MKKNINLFLDHILESIKLIIVNFAKNLGKYHW